MHRRFAPPTLFPRPPFGRREALAVPTRAHADVLTDVARTRAEQSAADLRRFLQALAKLEAATPQDLQLLAALDRWAAGDLA